MTICATTFSYFNRQTTRKRIGTLRIIEFWKPDYFSKNNTAYWLGKKYIGIGPSAHSYNGKVEVGISPIILCI